MTVAAYVQKLERELAEAREQINVLKGGMIDLTVERDGAEFDAKASREYARSRAQDAARYQWLKARYRGADFAPQGGGDTLLTFDGPCVVTADLDRTIDAHLPAYAAAVTGEGDGLVPRGPEHMASGAALAVSPAPVEFHVWSQSGDDAEFVSQVSGPRDTALSEARRYAAQAAADGDTVIIEEVTRREVERLTPVTFPLNGDNQ
jgi:hypothetical protein